MLAMRRWETLVALAAVIVASAGALPIPGRLYYTGCGVFMIAVVGLARLAARLSAAGTNEPSDAHERAQRIRESRRRR
jgi:hypothetical protein